MATKLDFYHQKLSGQASEAREYLAIVEDDSLGLRRKDKEAMLDYLAKMDAIQRFMLVSKPGAGPDRAAEKNLFETVQKRTIREAAVILRALGGAEGLKAARPADVTEADYPWWFVDAYLARQKAKQLKSLIRGLIILAVIGLVVVVLFNTVLKPDPAVVAQTQHYEQALSALMVEQDLNLALQEIEQSLAFAPEDLEALAFKGVVLELLGRTGEAQEVYEQAARVAAPEYALFSRGRILLQFGKREEAKTLAEEAINLNPNFAEGWFLLGQVYDELGDIPQAFEAMNTASELALEQGNEQLYAIIRVNMGYLAPAGP
jgi:tetratricopeptide (TPR) repeat protein